MSWARWSEVAIGVFVGLSPIALDNGGEPPPPALGLGGALTVLLALLGRTRRARYAHLLVAFTGLWIAADARFGGVPVHPLPPLRQGAILCGLTLMLLAVVPSRCFEPPAAWMRARRAARALHPDLGSPDRPTAAAPDGASDGPGT